MPETISADDPRIVREKQRGIARRESTLEDELPKMQQRLSVIEQYTRDHDKLHEELAMRAGQVEEVRMLAHAQMMKTLEELMTMISSVVVSQGLVAPPSDNIRFIEEPQREFTFEIERRSDGLMQRVIARPKLDG